MSFRTRPARRYRTFLVTLLAALTIATPVVALQAVRDDEPTQWVDAGSTYWRDEPGAAALAATAPQAKRAEQFYFVLPDRFANGDTGNDKGGRTGDRLKTGYDPTDKGFYHGGDLAGVIDKLDYIEGLGTTAIWLAPVFANRPVQGTGADVSAGYHGYWIEDFTRVDPHFGTNADLKKLVKLAHSRGIKIFLDVIVNHTADVIRYEENRYSYVEKKDSPYTDVKGRAFDDADFADGTRDFPAVDAASGPYTPVFATGADKRVKVPSWLNDPAMYHNRGNSSFAGENSTYGDFFGLDDLWTERPEVVEGMTKIYQDWITSTGIDGYRLDTAKHVDMDFWPQFAKGIAQAAERAHKPDFFMFGEVYSADASITSSYVRQGGLQATLDFGFQAAAQGFVTGGSGQGLADLYATDPLYTTRGTDAGDLPTFLGNHDMGRIGSAILKYSIVNGGGEQDALERDRLAHELMFLTRGQPVVYSGDEQGFTGPGGDKDARQDMFASRVADYLDDDLLGTDRTHAVDNFNTAHPLYRSIAALGDLRAAHPGLRDGTQTTRYAGDGVFAFSRLDAAQRVEYVVAANSGTGEKTVTVDTFTPGAAFGRLYPTAGAGPVAGADGKLTITIPALTTIAWKAGQQVPGAAAPTISIASPAAGAAVATQAAITATVTGAPSSTVTFAAKVGSGPWKTLGTATRAPYTVHHDLAGLAGKTAVQYKAVVKDPQGRTATATTNITVATPVQGAQRDYVLVHYQRPAGDYDGWGVYNWGDSDASSQHPWPTGQPFAGRDSYGAFAWVKVKPGATNVGFLVVNGAGQKDVESDRSIDPSRTGEIWLKQGDATIYPSQAAAAGYVDVHYHRPDGDYAGWGLHLWGDGLGAGAGTDWGSPRQPDGTDAFGAFWRVPVGDATKPINFIVHSGDNKDPNGDLTVDMTVGSAWVNGGSSTVHPTKAAATNTAVLHYRREDGDYAGWGLHLWDGNANPVEWGSPLLPSSIDAYGATYVVPLVEGATGVNYIVHRGDAKDLPNDQRLDVTKKGYEVWLLAGVEKALRPLEAAAARDIDLTHSSAQWIDRSTIAWAKPDNDGKVYDLVVSANGNVSVVDGKLAGDFTTIRLSAGANGLTDRQRIAHPELWAYQAFQLGTADLRVIRDALRGRLIVAESDHLGNLLSATGVQTPGVLDDVYAGATAARLGPVFAAGRPTLSLWAPTATGVELQLFDSPAATATAVPMTRDDATGVWRAVGGSSWKGKYYRFRVTAYQPATRQFVTASVTDPYSVSLAANSTHSQIVDLADPALAPAGWDSLRKPRVTGRPQIQELSVRDFSISDTTVAAAQRGTYGAFTTPATDGMTELKKLADAGVTHLHLLPTFDFATAPERRADQAVPACDLPAMPPSGEGQQACVAAVAETDGYNWGYDPLHYTVPEGGYAVNPDGSARITEYRQMVQGINKAGLRVVLDVVYNHTSASGTDPKSVLDQVVPGYYHRLLADGTVATSTCCANTAPEHAMMGKLVVDSMVTWAKRYKVDGFRFDLMGHHPKANILAVRAALDALTLDRDGVDGRSILMYGEGWNFGEVANDARFVQATQTNMAGTGIGTFTDRLRDAVRGGGPFDDNPRIQGFASGLYTDSNGDPVNGTAAAQKASLLHQQDLIKLGLAGNLAGYRFTDSTGASVLGSQVTYNGSPAGYTASPSEAVTYVDAHDNEILYDTLAYKLPQSTSATDRARMQVVALSTVVLSQGTGFVTAGSSRLRSKSLDKNSYNSGDWFNAIRWDCATGNGFGLGVPPSPDNTSRWPYAKPLLADPALVAGCAPVELADARFAELLKVRASSPLFSLRSAADVQQAVSFPLSGTSETPGVITMMLRGNGQTIVVVINASPDAASQTVGALAGKSMALHPVLRSSADPVLAGSAYVKGTGTFTVPGRSVAVFVS
ncbi:pullulanase-type alpha-1,6-glucosidase [Allocatelliglobosispora scoriae]|uniref:1,4-alpha-D-glucan glucanohydrolase n=1 Tax=Allocatelliglobosispora scoriae TaxID=643052 RepID=A0A841BZT4_9ACTN|nr:pullulanase-type alpha-1,6-glucosidase [Allocatelliglobosispora scoriae]MBB5873106.1 pullulanase-type alpha-1,6-glucosidase [Allocatelliglobosispora scoriae]